jgi:DNA helicase-2/ATP-dependent DNA helicase PcrA
VLALNILESNASTRNVYRERFRAILVDEYQDTNLIQASIFKLLDNKGNISVVGDDSQAIYAFRAATVENILNYERDFTAKRVTLNTNYRSTPGIVNLANASIINNPRLITKNIRSNRPPTELPLFLQTYTPAEEAQFIIQEINKKIRSGIKRQNIAVLFRATRQVAILETELRKAGIPYVLVGGEDFFSLEHIKVVMDMVRLLVNPDDSIALASVQSIVGFSDYELIEQTEQQAEQLELPFWDVISSKQNIAINTSDYQNLVGFRRTLDNLKSLIVEKQPILPLVSRIIEFLTPYYKIRFANIWDDVQVDLGVLSDIASTYTSAADFVNSIALEQFQEDPSDLQLHPLTLTTIHSAKGLEWDVVFLIGLVEFWFPLKWAIQQCGNDEEERRLFYVAVTRAKNHLYLTSYGQSYNPYGKLMYQQLSRFIQELPSSVYKNIS